MHDRIQDQGLYELAATLISASADLNKFLSKRKLPNLSSTSPAPNLPLSAENAPFEDARGTIIEAAEQIIQLVRGPRGVLIDLSFQVNDFPPGRCGIRSCFRLTDVGTALCFSLNAGDSEI